MYGVFSQDDGTPSIIGPRRLIVGSSGEIDGSVLQHSEETEFAFEGGCVLRLNIMQPR